uniref:Uncharacterized protein n=1 Tax=Knipowitschia caucasica TaxID=637954 RepID=A0AAV2J993_KNICA
MGVSQGIWGEGTEEWNRTVTPPHPQRKQRVGNQGHIQMVTYQEKQKRILHCSVFGWYSWNFSLKFKVANHRQKLRQAGCPQLNLNKRPSETTNARKIKKAKKSEVNFMPCYPEGKQENDLEREVLIRETKKKSIDWKIVDELMENTYSLRRKEIVQDEPLVADVQKRWPALFFVRQLEYEFARLTAVNLRETLITGIDKYLDRFLELFRAKRAIPGLSSLLRQLENSDNSTHFKRAILLLGLPHFLRDDCSS